MLKPPARRRSPSSEQFKRATEHNPMVQAPARRRSASFEKPDLPPRTPSKAELRELAERDWRLEVVLALHRLPHARLGLQCTRVLEQHAPPTRLPTPGHPLRRPAHRQQCRRSARRSRGRAASKRLACTCSRAEACCETKPPYAVAPSSKTARRIVSDGVCGHAAIVGLPPYGADGARCALEHTGDAVRAYTPRCDFFACS